LRPNTSIFISYCPINFIKHKSDSLRTGTRGTGGAGYSADDERDIHGHQDQSQTAYAAQYPALAAGTSSQGEAHPGSLVPWSPTFEDPDHGVFGDASLSNNDYRLHESSSSSGGEHNRFSISEMYFNQEKCTALYCRRSENPNANSSYSLAQDFTQSDGMAPQMTPTKFNLSKQRNHVMEDIEESEDTEHADPGHLLTNSPRKQSTMENFPAGPRDGYEIERVGSRFEDLDDRPENRRLREAGTPRKETRGIAKFFKKIGKKPKKDKGEAPATPGKSQKPTSPSTPLTISADFAVLDGPRVHKTFSGQRDMSPTEEKTEDFVQRWRGWLPSFMSKLRKPAMAELCVRTNIATLWARLNSRLFCEDGFKRTYQDWDEKKWTIKVYAQGMNYY
jgi:hypothetical protein